MESQVLLQPQVSMAKHKKRFMVYQHNGIWMPAAVPFVGLLNQTINHYKARKTRLIAGFLLLKSVLS